MKGAFRLGLGFSLLGVILIGLATTASAERFTGGSYQIDASVIGNSFGGSQTGGSYQLTSSGGESVIGQGSGGSYKLDSGYVAQLQQSMQLSVQPNGLVAYYPLDEGTGNAVYDASSNANNGSLTSPTGTWGAGKVGTAYAVGSTSGDIRVPDNASLPTGQKMTVSFTLGVWLERCKSCPYITVELCRRYSHIRSMGAANRQYEWSAAGILCRQYVD